MRREAYGSQRVAGRHSLIIRTVSYLASATGTQGGCSPTARLNAKREYRRRISRERESIEREREYRERGRLRESLRSKRDQGIVAPPRSHTQSHLPLSSTVRLKVFRALRCQQRALGTTAGMSAGPSNNSLAPEKRVTSAPTVYAMARLGQALPWRLNSSHSDRAERECNGAESKPQTTPGHKRKG